jgi:tetratricopeptide (TPR) repeat protein
MPGFEKWKDNMKETEAKSAEGMSTGAAASAAWKEEVRTNGCKWHTWFAWAIMVIYPAWTIFDYLLVQEHWQLFGMVRLLGSAALGMYLLTARLLKYSNPVVLGYLNVLVMYVSIAWMMPYTGDAMWFYSLGYSTAFIVAGLMLYWDWQHSLITTATAIVSYAVFFALLGDMTLIDVIGGGAFLTLTLAVISVVLLAMRMKLNKKEFLLRMQLLQTREQLEERLDEITRLKFQQDGDYFLTSQLIKPLSGTSICSDSVQVETLLQQKKKFTFRKWKEQLGGDINIADRIQLDNRNYVVFLNADAMGKSMQGAGGILVLGSLFRAIIDRSKLVSGVKIQYPERWLKNTFIELHRVFESFDGSMLVSLVLGLVEEETGLLYHINAEHPRPVLYRKERAEFLQADSQTFYKLGTMGMKGSLAISLFQMQPGDALILGSDGRDDIKMENSGSLEINSNELLFLDHVSGSGGDLQKIHDSIHAAGEPIDDISLLKITYSPSSQLPRMEPVLPPSRLRQMKHQVKTLIEARDYEPALAMTETILNHHPGQSEMLFAASWLYKRTGALDKAVNAGERLKLRSPDMSRNLFNLVDIHLRLGNHDRAGFILEKLSDRRDQIEAALQDKLGRLESRLRARKAGLN